MLVDKALLFSLDGCGSHLHDWSFIFKSKFHQCSLQNAEHAEGIMDKEGKEGREEMGGQAKGCIDSSRANASSANLTLAERMSKKKGKKGNKEDKKRKVDSISESTDDDDAFYHVFETAAEVERLW